MLTRLGFTLVETVVALVLMALMAAVLVPAVMSRLGGGESDALAANLSGLSSAVVSYQTDLGRYPRRLTYLTTPIAAGTLDLCGVTIPNVALWNGPYAERSISANGVRVGSAVISDTITRLPGSSSMTTAVGNLVFTVREVDQTAASAVNADLDGDGSLTAGSVRWAVGGIPGRGTLTYLLPIRGC